MPTSDVAIIVLKQLASCLAMPMFVIGADGEILFFNESTEVLLGRRYDEWQAMERHEWGALIRATDASGTPLVESERPMVVALDKGEPVHRHLWLDSGNGQRQELRGTALPLVSKSGVKLGALGLYWAPGHRLGQPGPEPAPQSNSQHEVEVILMRRLASYLATPIFIQSAVGELLYFNPAAEPILGMPFEQLKMTPRDTLYSTFRPLDLEGRPIDSDEHPLNIARHRREPAHRRFSIDGLDGVRREIEATAIPIVGQSGRMLGSAGFFWGIGKS